MGLGKKVRLNRIFSNPSGRLCSVAVDHFVGYAGGMPKGLADLPKTVAQVVEGIPDAITMQKGAAITCWQPHAGKIPLIIQAGCFTPDDRIIESLATPEDCVRMGADALAIAIGVRGPNEGKFIKMLSDGVRSAYLFDLPVIAHIYPRRFGSGGGEIVQEPEEIAWAVRVGIECGADVIKVAYTGDVNSFAQIVATCPVPIVAAGGPKTDSLLRALSQMEEIVKSGARGATIGRNVWGHGNVGLALAAFKSVIHDGIDSVSAMGLASIKNP